MKTIFAKSIEVSPVAYDLIDAFNKWVEESAKTNYRFSEEERYYLERMIKIMQNHISLLEDYEKVKDL